MNKKIVVIIIFIIVILGVAVIARKAIFSSNETLVNNTINLNNEKNITKEEAIEIVKKEYKEDDNIQIECEHKENGMYTDYKTGIIYGNIWQVSVTIDFGPNALLTRTGHHIYYLDYFTGEILSENML